MDSRICEAIICITFLRDERRNPDKTSKKCLFFVAEYNTKKEGREQKLIVVDKWKKVNPFRFSEIDENLQKYPAEIKPNCGLPKRVKEGRMEHVKENKY